MTWLRIKGPPPVVVLNGRSASNTCFTTRSSSGISSGGLFCTCFDSPISFDRKGTNESLSKSPNVPNNLDAAAMEFPSPSFLFLFLQLLLLLQIFLFGERLLLLPVEFQFTTSLGLYGWPNQTEFSLGQLRIIHYH